MSHNSLGAIHKRQPRPGKKGSLTGAVKGGPSEPDVCTFWWKNLGFSEFTVCCTDKEWAVRTLCGQRRGVNFLRFCLDVFYGWPL